MTLCFNTLSQQKHLLFSVFSTEEWVKPIVKSVIISSKTEVEFDIKPTLFSMSSNALSKFLEEETESLF